MKKLSNLINESFVNEDAKDDQRINDIISKSGGNTSKEVQLATNMAKAITDKSKALRRYQASLAILGKDHNVTIIFGERALELGNAVDITAEHVPIVKVLPGSKRPHDQQYKSTRKPYQYAYRNGPTGTPILPCGSLNLVTGNNKYFNVKTNGQSTLEVWKDDSYGGKDKYRIVITSGSTPICQIGTQNAFNHDQNGRPLFYGTMVDYIEQEHMAELIPLYGKSILQYVYK